MTVAILGAGNVGGGLAAAAVQAEHPVTATVTATVAASTAELGDALAGRVLVDATNPLDDTCCDLTTSGVSAAEQLQQQAPGARVVKALDTVFASSAFRLVGPQTPAA
jgi:8-hydroxy-5-deazaflavin:NADPH oxidoreductase